MSEYSALLIGHFNIARNTAGFAIWSLPILGELFAFTGWQYFF